MRRAFAVAVTVIGLLGVGLATCVPKKSASPTTPVNSTPAEPRLPFGSHRSAYAPGSIFPSNVSQAQLDQATARFYDTWKPQYLLQECGVGRYLIASRNKPRELTVSEATGYGMIISVLIAGHDPDAKRHFDGMYQFFRDHPSSGSPDLMSWAQSPSCTNVGGDNSATDGDLDIAYALLLADKQWGSCGGINYRAEALEVIEAIERKEVDGDEEYLMLGDWVKRMSPQHVYGTRSSDIMMGHFASFAVASGDSTWTKLIESSYRMIGAIQAKHSPKTGLVPDFIKSPGSSSPMPAFDGFLEGAQDGEYYYNACRNPWRWGLAYLHTGDRRAHAVVQRTNVWLMQATGGDPNRIRAGYKLDGTPGDDSAHLSMAFVAPFGVAAMVDAANQAWLDALWKTISEAPPDGYYEDILKLLGMLVISNNWWSPDAMPDPCAAG